MLLFKRKNKVDIQIEWKIKRKCLDLILECAKSSYPKEFGGLLRIDEKSKDTISELVILPGTISGDSHAIFKLHMLPIDFTVVGTVHSHPGPSADPSEADLQLFRKRGKIHIIAAQPFNRESWRAYDYNGNKVDMKVI
jgi:proteasome lid subunit RPN8/RPN11